MPPKERVTDGPRPRDQSECRPNRLYPGLYTGSISCGKRGELLSKKEKEKEKEKEKYWI
jgi:hypothetical protein